MCGLVTFYRLDEVFFYVLQQLYYMMVTRRLGSVDATQTRVSLCGLVSSPHLFAFPFSLPHLHFHATFLSVLCRFAPSLLKLVFGIHPLPCCHTSPQSYLQPTCLLGGRTLTPFPRAAPGIKGWAHPMRKRPSPHAPLVNLCLFWTGKRTLPVLGPGCHPYYSPPPLSHTPKWNIKTESPGMRVLYPRPPCSVRSAVDLRERR